MDLKATLFLSHHPNDQTCTFPFLNSTTMSIKKVIVVYGGELAHDVAQRLESKKPSSSTVSCALRNASERPKTLLEHGPDVLVCFILQTIENGNPTEDVSISIVVVYIIINVLLSLMRV